MSYSTSVRLIEAMGYENILKENGIDALKSIIINNQTPTDAVKLLELFTNNVKYIVVASHFGDKKVSKDDFTKEWVEHTKQLWRMSYDTEWMEYVSNVADIVRVRAEQEFDRLWKEKPNISTFNS